GQALSSANTATFSFNNGAGGSISATVSSPVSITIPPAATLGLVGSMNQYVWVYALYDQGGVDLCVSGTTVFFDTNLNSPSVIGTESTGGGLLYCSQAHAGSLPTKIIGRLLVNEPIIGAWTANPTAIALLPVPTPTMTDWTFAGTLPISGV